MAAMNSPGRPAASSSLCNLKYDHGFATDRAGERGALVGTSRESISRIFTEFSDEKIIRLKGKEITILNETLLKQISSKG